ncbi:MAG: hypothetical protein EBU97_05655 [Rhodobacteraceae bacterium]|nr:hypothetical protein [Paracoccaceae bacterium]
MEGAQIGLITAQRRAERENTAEAIQSAMRISRAMAGSTVIRPVLPTATTIDTANRIPNALGSSLGPGRGAFWVMANLLGPVSGR